MKQRLVFYKEVVHSLHYKAVDNNENNAVSSIYILKKSIKKPYSIVIDITIEEVRE